MGKWKHNLFPPWGKMLKQQQQRLSMGGGITLKLGSPTKLHGTKVGGRLVLGNPHENQFKHHDIVQTSNKSKREAHVKRKKKDGNSTHLQRHCK